MTLSIVNSALTDQIIKALCNTLVNSLWQGLILAAVAGLIVIGTKRASSALRYNLLILALVVFALGTLVTFGMQLQKVDFTTGSGSQLVNNVVSQNTIVMQNYTGNVVTQPESLMAVITGYLNTYHNTIVLIWFLIICAKSIQLAVGLYGTYRLKRSYVVAAGGFWNERMHQLAAMLGIKQSISLLESGLAKVPMVIGHLKPVILIPIGLLTALSAEEVEAILVHELAHIKRRDYLVNMLQSLVEIVFFFNPAVLWISQLIKTERENCCDDMVLEQSSNKLNYIRALVSCEEYQAAVPAYAMAFPGGKNSLLDRVKRLSNNRNHSLNLYEKTVLAICLVISGLCMSAFAEKDNIKRVVHHITKAFEHKDVSKSEQELVKQTEALNLQTAIVRKNTMLFQAKSAGIESLDTNKKFHLNVNVDPIKVTVPDFKVVVNPVTMTVPNVDTKFILSPVDVHLSPLNVQVPELKVNTDFKLNLEPDVKIQLNKVDVHLDPINVSLGSLGSVDTNKKTKGKGASAAPSANGKGASASSSPNGSYSYSAPTSQTYSSSSSTNSAAPKASSNSYSYSSSAPAAHSNGTSNSYSSSGNGNSYSYSSGSNGSYSYSGDSTTKYKAPRDAKALLKPNPISSKLVEELVNAHLVTDKNKLSVTLNNTELVINGGRQSEENHQLMLKKFQKNANDNVNITYNSYSNEATSNYAPKAGSMPSLADELVKAGLMTQKDKDKQAFSAHLDDTELVINGVKQSEENHQAILKKFSQHLGGGVNVFYNYSSKGGKSGN